MMGASQILWANIRPDASNAPEDTVRRIIRPWRPFLPRGRQSLTQLPSIAPAGLAADAGIEITAERRASIAQPPYFHCTFAPSPGLDDSCYRASATPANVAARRGCGMV